MIEPILKDDALLADIAAARQDLNARHIWWLGQSGFLILAQDRFLLIDPYLSDSLSASEPADAKRHARMTDLAIAPSRLDMLDVIAVTHEHPDHFDPATLKPLLTANPTVQLVLPASILAKCAKELGVAASRLIGMQDGMTRTVGEFACTPIPAAHEDLTRDDAGRHLYLGYSASIGNWTVYHSGDTMRYPGLVERLRPLQIDVALLPINGKIADPNIAGNLNGAEAAQLAHDSQIGLAIPCHYDMFAFNTVTPDAFINACNALGQNYAILQSGERLSLQP